jgi:hypothetical protein
MTALAGWENFYVIVGSCAGALIGLQFVVITLIADRPITPDLAQASDAFATPTVVHFGTVLLLSAALNAPWHGIGGLIYLPWHIRLSYCCSRQHIADHSRDYGNILRHGRCFCLQPRYTK